MYVCFYVYVMLVAYMCVRYVHIFVDLCVYLYMHLALMGHLILNLTYCQLTSVG